MRRSSSLNRPWAEVRARPLKELEQTDWRGAGFMGGRGQGGAFPTTPPRVRVRELQGRFAAGKAPPMTLISGHIQLPPL